MPVTLPVFLRIGDGEECRVGEISADSAAEMQRGVPEFLFDLAAAFEQRLTGGEANAPGADGG